MKLVKLVLAVLLVLMLSANTQCVFESDDDDDDDDDDHPKKQQEQPMKQDQGEAPGTEMQ